MKQNITVLDLFDQFLVCLWPFLCQINFSVMNFSALTVLSSNVLYFTALFKTKPIYICIQLHFILPKLTLTCPICKAIERNSQMSFAHKLDNTIQWNVYCSVNSGKNTIYRVQLTTCTMLYSLQFQLQCGDMQQMLEWAACCTLYSLHVVAWCKL